MEELFRQRFNYYGLIVSALLIAIFNTQSKDLQQVLLIAGVIIFGLMAVAIWRTNLIVNRLLNKLHEDETHPYTLVSKLADKPKLIFLRFRANNMFVFISICIWLLPIALLIGTNWLGWELTVSSKGIEK